jgi:hypothetical protein
MEAVTPAQAQLDFTRDLLEMARAYQLTQLLYTAASLGLADIIARGPIAADALADATGTHAPSLHRLLRALTSIGVFSERDDGLFELTPLGSLLETSREDSIRPILLHAGGDMYRIWGELEYSVRTGAPAFPKVFGVTNWERRQQNPDVNAIFNGNQAAMTRVQGAFVVDAYPFPEEGLVIDVGGGNGTLMSLVLKRYPRLRGVLLDQPHVVEQASVVLASAGVFDRCRTEGGDFFESVPRGGDVFILSRVLNDWDDLKGRQILERCREAMPATARLILVNDVLTPRDRTSVINDLHMLVTQGGRGRTEEEWRALLLSAGFELNTIFPSATTKILEALPR